MLYQRGIIAIPRSSQKTHMQENLYIFIYRFDEQSSFRHGFISTAPNALRKLSGADFEIK